MIDDTLVPHLLFGGACDMAFPDRFTDVSDFRPVPDHQEVRAMCSMRGWEVAAGEVAGRHWRGRQCGRGRGEAASGQARSLPHRHPQAQVFADASLDQSLIVEIMVSPSQ